MKNLLIVILFGAFVCSVGAYADDGSNVDTRSNEAAAGPQRFLYGKSDGWFWNKDPVDKVKPQQKPIPPKEPNKDNQPMTVEWLRKKIPEAMDAAINNPSKENIANYLYLQRVMMDKSQRFAENAQHYVYSDPLIDENNRAPISTGAKREFMNKNYFGREAALKYLAKNVGGIVMFFDSKCTYCRTEGQVVKMVGDKYGFAVKYVSMDGKGMSGVSSYVKNAGLAIKLHLQITPATVFIVPPNNYYVISQGMLAVDGMEDRILAAASDNNLLPQSLRAPANPWDNGVLTTQDTNGGGSDDPVTFVNNVKSRLQQRY